MSRSRTNPLYLPDGRLVRVHRVNDSLTKEIQWIGGLPITSVRRTLLDVTGVRHPRAEPALDQALRSNLTSLGQLWLLYDEEWTRGRRGIAILRSHLLDRTPGPAPSESELEDMLAAQMRVSNLPAWKQQYPIALSTGRIRIDFAYPRQRIAIECDSYSWHSDRLAFERDRRRDLELQAMGWVVLRFTWAQIKFEPAAVIAHIRHHISARALAEC